MNDIAPVSPLSDPHIVARLIDQIFSTVRTVVWAVLGLGVTYQFFHAVEAFAGRDTSLTLALKAAASLSFAAPFGFGLICLLWALGERTLRHRKVGALQGRIKELETKVDPNRSSSMLTPEGRTNPVDRIGRS